MAHFKKLIAKENVGKLVYGDNIVNEIVAIAVSEVPYVELNSISKYDKDYSRSIKVNFDKDGVHISVVVKVCYNQSVSDMAFKIQETVRHNVESMTEYHVASVNVSVKDVVFEDILNNASEDKEDSAKSVNELDIEQNIDKKINN